MYGKMRLQRESTGFPSMSEELDVLIQRKETEFSVFCKRMEQLKNDFIREMTDFAPEWYKKIAQYYVSNYSQVILNMRTEKIAKMKTQINELIRNSEKIVKGELENPELWWHKKPFLPASIEQYLQVGDKKPEIIDNAVRRVLGCLGLILEAYNYNVTTKSNTGSFEEFWFDRPHGPDSDPVPYYPHLLKWSEQMEETIQEYNAQYINALPLFTEIENLKDEKKQRQALNLWDSI